MSERPRLVPLVRRSTSGDPPQKMGWQVRSSVADAVRRAVEEGVADSQNAFVERALIRELRELRRSRVYDAYSQAASDPTFLEDMSRTTREFEPAVGDGLAEAG